MVKLISLIYDYLGRRRRAGIAIRAMSCLMVFIVTYMLILPAFTLDKDEAADQGGIDVPQAVTDDAGGSDASPDDAVASEVVSDDLAASDTVEATETTKVGDTPEKKKDARMSTHLLAASGDTYDITLLYDDTADIPNNAKLHIREITEGDKEYQRLCDEADQAMKLKYGADLENQILFDIGIYVDDKEIEPADGSTVKVEIRLDSEKTEELAMDNCSSSGDSEASESVDGEPAIMINGIPYDAAPKEKELVVLHHAANDLPEIVSSAEYQADENGNLTIDFETDSFSKYQIGSSGAWNSTTINAGRKLYVGDEIYVNGKVNINGSSIATVENRGASYNLVKLKAPGEITISGDAQEGDSRKQYNYTFTVENYPLQSQNSKPATINTVTNEEAGITLNLFDYDLNGLLNETWNSGGSNPGNPQKYYIDEGLNKDKKLKFWTMCPGYDSTYNNGWTGVGDHTFVPGIVGDKLVDGYPKVGDQSLDYLFNPDHNLDDAANRKAYVNADGLFKYIDGYYIYDSSKNYAYYPSNGDEGKFEVYEKTYEYKDGGTEVKKIGFFPFHPYNEEYEAYDSQNHSRLDLSTISGHQQMNHHFGMSMSAKFAIPSDGKDMSGEPITYEFSGDDDMWVFIGDDLALDLGGIHQPVSGRIEFLPADNGNINVKVSTKDKGASEYVRQRTLTIKANKEYTLRSFYIERGGGDSNCKIMFNLPTYRTLKLAKRLNGLSDKERAKYKDEWFTYELNMKTAADSTFSLYRTPDEARESAANQNPQYDLRPLVRDAEGYIIGSDGKRIANGTGGTKVETADNKSLARWMIVDNGQVKIKDGWTVEIPHLSRSDVFYVAEEKTINMDEFEAPHAERDFFTNKDGEHHEEELKLTDSVSIGENPDEHKSLKDWQTQQYTLQETEKITFTNTLKEKDLEVDKKWEGEGQHPNTVEFTVSAAVEGDDGALQPYSASTLKEADGTTDKKFTLSEDGSWRTIIEHLPVESPDGKLILYDIKEVHVEGYVSSAQDLTASGYKYCNVDAVKLWPDDQHDEEVITVRLKNGAGKYYAGTDEHGNAKFNDTGNTYDLTKDNNYTHRFARLPHDDTYTVEQTKDQNENTKGLVTYKHDVIQYQLTNTPVGQQVDPSSQENPEIHKRIDALRDGVPNPDSAHTGEDLTDLYRLYLDYKINSLQEANGVDLLFVIDHSGSMNSNKYGGNVYRARSVEEALNGQNGIIAQFLDMNKDGEGNSKNRWAAVGFKGPYGIDYVNPFYRSRNAGISDSEILSGNKNDYTWLSESQNIRLPLEGINWIPFTWGVKYGETVLTDYTAGFWRAEQFLLQDEVKADGRKKVIIFISDGIPTLHIEGLDQAKSLAGADSAMGSKYYSDDEGGCTPEAKTQFGYFVNDMQKYGYGFGDDMELYTIGFGGTIQSEAGKDLLKDMLKTAYGDSDHEGNFMTINDINPYDDYSNTAANKLKEDLRTIMGMNESFSNIAIKDDLSKYVDLIASKGETDLLKSSKAKVTMTDPDDQTKTVVLWENGSASNDTKAKFTNKNNQLASIISKLEYDASTKTVKAVFDSEYEAKPGVTYTLSFDVKTTDEAYKTYAESGYDKYADGDNDGKVITGDPDTDYKGTTPTNSTSSGKEGFRSNDGAKATFKHNDKLEKKEYPHPVIQVFDAPVQLLKTDQTGAPLAGAKFRLYKDAYDASGTDAANQANAANLMQPDMQSKITGDGVNQVAEISTERLRPGTYYLVETEAPAGYNGIEPIKIVVSVSSTVSNGVTNDAVSVTATQSGTELAGSLARPGKDNDKWVLKVRNTAGYELPAAGGLGTRIFTILGGVLVLGSGVTLLLRRRRIN